MVNCLSQYSFFLIKKIDFQHRLAGARKQIKHTLHFLTESGSLGLQSLIIYSHLQVTMSL